MYLLQILEKYNARNFSNSLNEINNLKFRLQDWGSKCEPNVIESGSLAKGTAISLSSDIDYLVSLSSETNGSLKDIYESLYVFLNGYYGTTIRKQNVSIRISINGLSVDVTPARRQKGYINYHSIYNSKSDAWTQTNINQHIIDISRSGRKNDIVGDRIWTTKRG